ncbi:MAG: hypothetical protein ACREQM_15565 [Candidatus Dormibacteraceae bacterium]
MTEDRLGAALAGWASASRLSDRERQRIRTAVLLTPNVDAVWWERFNARMERVSARCRNPRRSERWARVATSADRVPLGWGCAA